MGQRHNRRRTRPRSRNTSTNSAMLLPVKPVLLPPTRIPASDLLASELNCPESRLASTRHCRWPTWQESDITLRSEAAMLETEQYRLFGGEPGDDVGLCYRMLEYFGGLDYINSSQALKPLPG